MNLFFCADSNLRCGVVRLLMASRNETESAKSIVLISGRLHVTPAVSATNLSIPGKFTECQQNYYKETNAANCEMVGVSATEKQIRILLHHVENGDIKAWNFTMKTYWTVKNPDKSDSINCRWPAVSSKYEQMGYCCEYESVEQGTVVDCFSELNQPKPLSGYRLVQTNYDDKTKTMQTIFVDTTGKTISIRNGIRGAINKMMDIDGKLLTARFVDSTGKQVLFAVKSNDTDTADVYWCEGKCNKKQSIKISSSDNSIFALDHVPKGESYLLETGNADDSITFSTGESLIRYAMIDKPLIHSISGGNVRLIHNWSNDAKNAQLQAFTIKFAKESLTKEYVPAAQSSCGSDGLSICGQAKPTA